MSLQLSELNLYPVKSCAGISLPSLTLDRFGPAGDRRWMVVDPDGMFMTQRGLPRMALIQVALQGAGIALSLGTSSVEAAVPGDEATAVEVEVWGDRVDARDAGDEVARWLGDTLGQDCRLVYMPDDGERQVDPAYAAPGQSVAFADGFPVLLISQASLDEINRRLDQPVPMNRFRPNLVVSGSEPFAEDTWRQVRIGDVTFEVAKPCSRCAIPSIIQETAQRDTQINRVLAGFRRRDGQIFVGQNLLYDAPGTLRVGDAVEVLV